MLFLSYNEIDESYVEVVLKKECRLFTDITLSKNPVRIPVEKGME